MNFFQSTVEFFEILGVTPNSRPFNARNLLSIFVFGLTLVLCCVFLVCEAQDVKDYTESIYMSSVFITILLVFLSFIWKKENIFKFITTWKEITESRKCESWKCTHRFNKWKIVYSGPELFFGKHFVQMRSPHNNCVELLLWIETIIWQ